MTKADNQSFSIVLFSIKITILDITKGRCLRNRNIPMCFSQYIDQAQQTTP